MNNNRPIIPDNFDFVPFPQNVNTQFVTSINARRKGNYSGYADIAITTVDDLYIGSGFCELIEDSLVSQTQTIIPASSLKGAVRQVARAVSDACIPLDKIAVPVIENGKAKVKESYGIWSNVSEFDFPTVKSEQNRSCTLKPDENGQIALCIVCDMFGMMSLGSKVRFTDMKADNLSLTQLKMPQQYSPKTAANKYWYQDDGKAIYHGYKFYKTHCEPRNLDGTKNIEAIKQGVTFRGRIYFNHLFEEQLQLLMYSLGVGKYISLKLGGYKADGMGTVKTKCTQLIINGEAHNAEKYAADYADAHYDDLEDIEYILKYRKE